MNEAMNHVAATTLEGNSGVFRHSARDAVLPLATLAQGLGLLALLPHDGLAAALGIALNLWWTSNTVSHIHLHTPIFRSRALNRAFSIYLSALTCVPQGIWKQRHLWHHAGEAGKAGEAGGPVGLRRARLGAQGALEMAAIAIVIVVLASVAPRFLLTALGPGVALGLLLCHLQGAMEHGHDGEPISHYGALYNFFWFNDGHHVEHHARPTMHWTSLPAHRVSRRGSALPPFLRFFERTSSLLGALERLPLASSLVRRAMIAVHRAALRRVLTSRPRSVAIVGGALFPRTVLALRPLLPGVRLTVIDASAESIAIAHAHLGDAPDVEFVQACYDPAAHDDHELVILPLAYVGDRGSLYTPGRARRLVHDWAWRVRGARGTLVSLLLLKRLNVVDPA